jgi:signal transduction histidine kinase
MRVRSLSDKIVLYFVTIGIIAIAIVSTYSFRTSRNALLSRTFDQLTSVRVFKKDQIRQFFRDRKNELELLAQSVNYPDQNSGLNNYLVSHLLKSGYYSGIYITSVQNTNIYHFSGDSVRQEERAGLPVSEPDSISAADYPVIYDFSKDGSPDTKYLYISKTVLQSPSGEIVRIFMEIPLEVINGIMLEQNPGDGMGQSGESYLVGPDGLMRSSSRFVENSVMEIRVETCATEESFLGHSGTSILYDYRGIQVLSSYSPLEVEGLNWAILAEIDYKEATRSVYMIRNNILFLTILVAVVLFIISFIFSKRLILPLNRLNEATARIRAGNLDITLDEAHRDEIGQLTHSFNAMAGSLREKDMELSSERNKRLTAMIDGQEHERKRLSRELHDGLGQNLIALKLRLEGMDNRDICSINKTISEVKSSCDGTIGEIRRISNNLMPAVLTEFGLVTAVRNICNDLVENGRIHLDFSSNGNFSNLSDRHSIYLFRIIQEALNNVVKHSNADKVTVILDTNENRVYTSISDNGKGFPTVNNGTHSGNGLVNMHERARLLDGKINIQSGPGKGTQITLEIPLQFNGND